MSATAVLSAAELTVTPGEVVEVDVVVRNTGSVVDELVVDVLGPAAPWATTSVPAVSLYPGADGHVIVRFAPPREPSTSVATVPFAVRVTCREDPAGTVVHEGTVAIGAFRATTAELQPRTATGRRRSRFEVAIDNRGNEGLDVDVVGHDADETLRYEPPAQGVEVTPGAAGFAPLTVRPRKRFLRGPARTHQFEVVVAPSGEEPIVLEGTFVQQPLIPKWLPRALAALLALAVALAVLWFALLRPTIETTARATAEEAGAEAGRAAAQQPLGASGGGGAPTDAAGDPATGATNTAGVEVDLVDGRLTVGAPDFVTPAGATLLVTDVFLQNPLNVTSGFLRVQRVEPDGATADLLVVNLANFRDIDYHFLAPLRIAADETLRLRAECPPEALVCEASLTFSGRLERTR